MRVTGRLARGRFRPLPGPAERAAIGRAARAGCPRSGLGVHSPGPDRRDPVTLLEEQAATRVPELVPIRYGRMLVSPFTFYRGAARIMAADLAGAPGTGFTVQACGDAHLSNFGMFASRERRLVFDINDFDETLPGPWEWDVKRLVTSVLLAARDNGFAVADQERAVLATAAGYRAAMARFAEMQNLDVWYARTEVAELERQAKAELGARGRRDLARGIAKARTRDRMKAFSKLTREVDGFRRFISDPPLVVPIADFPEEAREDLRGRINQIVRAYRASLHHDRRVLLQQFTLVDVARKVVGVGSVGTNAWIALFLGRDPGDPLILQIKEAQPSVLEEFVGPSTHRSSGERVVAGQRITQQTGDIFLGWMSVAAGKDGVKRDYYVRQLRDWKGSAVIEEMQPTGLTLYGAVCGETLARAHARSGDRIAIAAYLGTGRTFERAMLRFAEAYAEQNAEDYAALSAAVASGRVVAQTGV